MKRYLMLAMVMMLGVAMAAPKLQPLTVQEMARYGATDALVIEADDLTVSTANGSQTNTITVTGPCSWEYRGYRLDIPFDASSVTNAMTCALTVSLDSQALVSGLQIASDQWRPYKAVVPATVSVTTTTSGPDTNALVSVSTGTWPYSGTITNGATSTLTCIIGAPGAAHTLNKTDTGQARVFFRIQR